jgi:undecaprenyl-diphosphatase
MTTWEAILLGFIQGITEFLPISSSGHLELSQYFLGFQDLDKYVLFNLVCHLGTLGSIFYIFYPQIKQSVTTDHKRFLQVVCGTLPLFPLVLILKPIKSVFDQPEYLGVCFLITAALLFASVLIHVKLSVQNERRRWTDPLAIGLVQAVAILPGISRSGATISAARLLGWTKEEAIQFSFLLAIPAILGGTVLEVWQLIKSTTPTAASISFLPYAAAFLTSFIVGCLALKGLIRMVANDKWIYFAWYCLFLGLMTFLYFNVIG